MTDLPQDSALPGLVYLEDEKLFATAVWSELAKVGPEMRVTGLQVVKHHPGRRMTLRLTLADVSGEQVVYAKLFAGERGAGIASLLQKLEQNEKSGPLRIPRLLAYLPEARLIVIEAARGKPLPELLSSGATTAPPVARALRQLHSLPLVSERRWDYASELEVTRLQLESLVKYLPETSAEAARLTDRIQRALKNLLPPVRLANIHRDLYPANISVETDGGNLAVWLLDLDLVTQGDPTTDVGNLMAEVKLEALIQRRRLEAFESWNQAFLDTYRFDGNQPPGRLSIFVAITLARNAGINAVSEKWRWTSVPLLEGARQWLRRAEEEGL